MAKGEELRAAVRGLNAEQFAALRDGYYKAAEGLAAVQQVLRAVAAENDAFRFDLVVVNHAHNEFKRSALGEVL